MYFAASKLTSMIPSFSMTELIRKKSGKNRHKTHNYIGHDAGVDYIFEPAKADEFCHLISQGRRIKCGDFIVLGDTANPRQYQVKGIEYYSNPSDMWIAALAPIVNESNGG